MELGLLFPLSRHLHFEFSLLGKLFVGLAAVATIVKILLLDRVEYRPKFRFQQRTETSEPSTRPRRDDENIPSQCASIAVTWVMYLIHTHEFCDNDNENILTLLTLK